MYRWTIFGDALRLEHLRFGHDQPVLLFDMLADADGVWREANAHHCHDDCYTAELRLEKAYVLLEWSVTGPEKHVRITYHYF